MTSAVEHLQEETRSLREPREQTSLGQQPKMLQACRHRHQQNVLPMTDILRGEMETVKMFSGRGRNQEQNMTSMYKRLWKLIGDGVADEL